MGVACGQAIRYKSSPFLPANPTRAVGFSLLSLTRPRTISLKHSLYVIIFFLGF